MDTTALRHLQPRRPKPLSRTFPMWARTCDDDGLVYRLYLRAGEGMAEVRHLALPINLGRSAIAQVLVATRQEMQVARRPRCEQASTRQKPAAETAPRAAVTPPPAAVQPAPAVAPVAAPSAEAQMALF
jgi:hypothetical protein